MPHVEIDTDRCSGHGRCYALAPEVFAPDDEGYGRLIPAVGPDGATLESGPAEGGAAEASAADGGAAEGGAADGGAAEGMVGEEHAEPLRLAGINCPEYAITITPT